MDDFGSGLSNYRRLCEAWYDAIKLDLQLVRGIAASFRMQIFVGSLIEAVHGFGRRLATWWESGFDLLITPTQAAPPPPIGFIRSTKDDPLLAFMRSAPYGACTLPFNMSGQPAISLPRVSKPSSA